MTTPQPEEHPDKILDDTAEILNQAGSREEIIQWLAHYQAPVTLAKWMLISLTEAGFSHDTAQEMVLVVWTKLFQPDYPDWDGFLGHDD